MIDHETHHTIETGIIPTIGIEATQIVEISDIKTTDQEKIQTTDQIIKDLTTTFIKIDHEITRKLENQGNMIKVENDYEPVICEQPFHSHIYCKFF